MSVAFSPDSRMLASGDGYSNVQLWDVKSGQVRKTFTVADIAVTCVAFSPDGKTLAASAGDHIRFWDVPEGQLLKSQELVSEPESIAWSPDGKALAIALLNHVVGLIDAQTLKTLWMLKEDPALKTIDSIAFSPDGGTLAVAGAGQTSVVLRDLLKGANYPLVTGQFESTTSVVFSPDGRRLALGNRDGTIELWNPRTDRRLKILAGRTDEAQPEAFRSGGKVLEAVSRDRIDDWDIAGVRKTTKRNTDFSPDAIFSAISPDGKTFASRNDDVTIPKIGVTDRIEFWDIASTRKLSTIVGNIGWGFSFSPDGLTAAVRTVDGIILYDVASGRRTQIAGGINPPLRQHRLFAGRKDIGIIPGRVGVRRRHRAMEYRQREKGRDTGWRQRGHIPGVFARRNHSRVGPLRWLDRFVECSRDAQDKDAQGT